MADDHVTEMAPIAIHLRRSVFLKEKNGQVLTKEQLKKLNHQLAQIPEKNP